MVNLDHLRPELRRQRVRDVSRRARLGRSPRRSLRRNAPPGDRALQRRHRRLEHAAKPTRLPAVASQT